MLTVNKSSRLFRFPGAHRQDPVVDEWMADHSDALGVLAREWFEVMRNCGSDVRELLHDGYPTACVGDAAFAYIGAFRSHVNVGFFRGAELPDPHNLLEGTGKYMRHVKLRPEQPIRPTALKKLIKSAYIDMKMCAEQEIRNPIGGVAT